MRIAFYAPLKTPSHAVPSGDRRIARLLLHALRRAGHEVRVVSTFRAYEGDGDARRQERIRRRGAALAEHLVTDKLRRRRPELWFTYHLYHKAPDWLGPPIAERLDIPYVVAEAAYAPRRAAGRWDAGLAAVKAALARADIAILLNPNDRECVSPLLRGSIVSLLPFLDTARYRRAGAARARHRRNLARRRRIPADVPWLLAVGMMRSGDKLASYQALGKALAGLMRQRWRLLVVGDGPARVDVRHALGAIARRVHWLGAVPETALPPLYAAADLLVWPAINEAIGMAILEAQATGLPTVSGDGGAIGVIVAEGHTGRLTPEGNVPAFRRAVAKLLVDTPARARMSAAATARIGKRHDIAAAAERLDQVLRLALERARKRQRR